MFGEKMFFDKLGGKGEYFLFVFRVFVGLLFFQHGAQKLLGWFASKGIAVFPDLMWWAGLIELSGGLLIAFGLFARPAAFIAALEMLVAYFMVHFPKNFVPIQNGGELALLYFACFLVIIAFGSGKWSVEEAIFKKKLL